MKLRNSLLLLLTATIWGCGLCGAERRHGLCRPVHLCVRAQHHRRTGPAAGHRGAGQKRRPASEASARGAPQSPQNARYRRYVLWHGAVRGHITQQFALLYTPVGKAGFLTACYILIVPLLGLLFGRRCGVKHWCGVALAMAGLYFLCMTGGSFGFAMGDLIGLSCALLFSIHITVHRPFFTDGGRREDVLHPVFLLCDLIGHRYADLRATELREHPRGMEAHPVCRCDVVRRGLYPADCRSEGHEPGGSIAYHESGVGYLGYRRLAYSRVRRCPAERFSAVC